MSQFYQIDSARVSHKEYWWGTRSPLVLIGWILKWLRIRIPGSTDDANTESTLPFVVSALPQAIELMFGQILFQFAQLGFHEPVYHQIYDAGTSTTLYWATLRHTSGQHMARVHLRVWGRSARRKPVLFPLFITRFTDGTFLVSSAGKPDVDAPPSIEMIRTQSAPVEALWTAHQQRAKAVGGSKISQPINSREEIIESVEALHILQRNFHLARGVFRPRTEKEQATARQVSEQVENWRAQGFEYPEVLAELEKLQGKKSSKSMVVWLLVGSLVLFAAIGAKQWDPKFTLWLLPVLFFHEAGHWVMMKIFGYRDLRMFFIPMFGAGVIGRHWNIAGWKKALVSLAGPLPGIIVGLALGIGSIMLHNPWMNKAALVLLALNGLNLLPIFPMDGGHVLHHTIFCRNRWLEVVFRVLAIGGLMLLAVSGRAFLYLAIAIGASLPITFKLAKVKEDLAKLNLPQPAVDEDRIPPTTAERIIKSVKDAFGPKMPLSNKAIAQHTLTVFESLNAKPPGTLATLGLLAMQGGGLFIAVIMGLILAFTGNKTLQDFAQAAARQPLHSVSCASIQQARAVQEQAPMPIASHLIVATFKKAPAATKAFQDLTNNLPAGGRLTLYGQSLLLSVPAGDEALRDKWFDTIQTRSTNLFVRASNAPVSLSLTFIAPTAKAASNLVAEVGPYLHASASMHLIAPWAPAAAGEKYAAYQKARTGWQSIDQELSGVYTQAEYKAYSPRLSAAMKRGAMAEFTKLTKDREEKSKELRTAMLHNMSGRSAGAITPEMADLYGKLQGLSYTNRVERQKLYREIAAHLGEVPFVDGKPDPAANAFAAGGGSITMHGLFCEVRYANFVDPQGLLAFTKWLCGKGFLQMQYDLRGGWMGFEDTADPDEADL